MGFNRIEFMKEWHKNNKGTKKYEEMI